MSRRDDLHFPVRRALEKDGWTITDDPLELTFRGVKLKADLGAERRLAAEKAGRKIAIEVKDFDSDSPIVELQKTIGQLQMYRLALVEDEPDRELFLAVNEEVHNRYFISPAFETLIEYNKINLLVFDHIREVVLRWIKQQAMPKF